MLQHNHLRQATVHLPPEAISKEFQHTIRLEGGNGLAGKIRRFRGKKAIQTLKPNISEFVDGQLLLVREHGDQFGKWRQNKNRDMLKEVGRVAGLSVRQDDLEGLFAETGNIRRPPQFPSFPEHLTIGLECSAGQSGYGPEGGRALGPFQVIDDVLEDTATFGVGLAAKVEAEFHVRPYHFG